MNETNPHTPANINTQNPRQFDIKKDSVSQSTHPEKSEQAPAPAITPTAPFVRAEVVAKFFDVHPRTVALWAQNGTVPCIRLGGALRFSMEAVLGAVR